MVEEKLESMHNTHVCLAESVTITSHIIAGVSGESLHYGCAYYVAIAVQSLHVSGDTELSLESG